MSAQRYTSPAALERMAAGNCPECGQSAEAHSGDPRFWIPRDCDLLPHGVTERIEQYRVDQAELPEGYQRQVHRSCGDPKCNDLDHLEVRDS